MRRWSIRWRLTWWYGGVLAGVLIAFGAAVYFIMGHHLLNRIDEGLAEELNEVREEVDEAQNGGALLAELKRRFFRHEGFAFQVNAADGSLLFAGALLEEQQFPVSGRSTHEGEVAFASLPLGDGRWRVARRELAGPEGPLIVQVGQSLDWYDHEMGELLAVLLFLGPATLAVALSGGYLLARRALRPVDDMTRTAGRITARRLDERLEGANPDDELGRLGRTLNGMIERLERSFREMQRFTADASHELRTPIAVIRNEAEVALNKPLSEEEKRNLLSSILEECERLTWITEQLLTLSREDAGIVPSVRESVDLGQLVAEVAETMRPLAEAKKQTMTAESNGRALVSGDPDRLRQVLYNLLDNAIKYTPDGGSIETALEAADGEVRLVIRDTGIGIPPEHLSRVFDRFYRVDKARSRADGGTGLGLSIVQSIVQTHGGTVEMTSTPGEGSCCIIKFPAERRADR